MTSLLTILILIGMTLYGLKEYYQVKLGVVPQKTPPAALTALAGLLERSADMGAFLDLGSGYGERVVNLAKRLPNWDIAGVEQSPTPWILANLRSFGKNYSNYNFYLSDPTVWSLREYNVIFLHQNEATLKRWETSLARRLQPGTLLISYKNPLPRVKPIDVIKINPQTVFYLYKKSEAAQAEPEYVLPIGEDDDTLTQGNEFSSAMTEEEVPKDTTLPL